MNSIRSIQALNKRELEAVVPPSASWHTDYRDTAYVFIGGLPFDLTEGDIVTIFSQFGEPTWIKLQRDKETGKSKGFAFLKYEDQRSTDLAVDNLGGATILGRTLRVDHTRYKKKEGQEDEDEQGNIQFEPEARQTTPSSDEGKTRRKSRKEKPRLMSKEEKELQDILANHDDEDPMKEYLISEKRKEIAEAEEQRRAEKHEHRHRRRHRHRDRSRSRERETRDRGDHSHRRRD